MISGNGEGFFARLDFREVCYAFNSRFYMHFFKFLAACQCIAELASKLSPEILAPHVNDLLSTLIETFHDDSWPVRDMACVACKCLYYIIFFTL